MLETDIHGLTLSILFFPYDGTAYRFFPWLMIFTIILICVLGRDFGLMLSAERASQPSPSRGAISEASREEPVSNKGSPPNDSNEQESSMDASEKGESCCHRRRQRNNNTTNNNMELQRYSNEAQEENSGENLFTGMCVWLRTLNTTIMHMQCSPKNFLEA